MNNSYNTIIKLLQNALWQSDIGEITDCNWNEVEGIVHKHVIDSIFASIEEDEIIPKSIKDKWKATAAYQMVSNRRLLAEQDSLLRILSNAGIPAVVLKGVAASQYFPYPELRPMGDIDFIVPRDKYEDTYNALSENGFSLMHERSEFERHIEFSHNGIIFELHRFYTVSNNAKHAEQLDNLIFTNIENCNVINVDGYSIPVLPHLINGMVLLQHINHHLEDGLGLRQIIDWIMFFSKVIVSSEIWDEFHQYVVQTGLEQLEYYITSMCIYYLGLRSPKDVYVAEKSVCDDLLQYILSSGNFGCVHTNKDKQVTTVLQRDRSMMQWIRRMCRNGDINWKARHDNSLLSPFAFIYEVFHCINLMVKKGISPGKIVALFQQNNKNQMVFEKMGAKMRSKGIVIYKNGKYEKK